MKNRVGESKAIRARLNHLGKMISPVGDVKGNSYEVLDVWEGKRVDRDNLTADPGRVGVDLSFSYYTCSMSPSKLMDFFPGSSF